MGIDVIGDYFIECNVTSSTGARELNVLDGLNIAEGFFDRRENRLEKEVHQ